MGGPRSACPKGTSVSWHPTQPIPITMSDGRRYSLLFLNHWYSHVSYGALIESSPARAGKMTKSDGVVCHAGMMWNWANNNFPNSSQDDVVVAPSSACSALVRWAMHRKGRCLPYGRSGDP